MYKVIAKINALELASALNALGPDDKVIQIVYISGADQYTLVYWVEV